MKLCTRSSLWRRICRRLGRDFFRLAENNEDCRFEHNGERWLLREWIRLHAARPTSRPLVLIDAGANIGGYTQEALVAAQGGQCPLEVHVFEPAPACQRRLQERFCNVPAVHLVAAAVGEAAGMMHLHDGRSGSSHASLVPRAHHVEGPAGVVEVPVRRLDDYLKESGIVRVDFLKLDVEGTELSALRGVGEFLRPELIPLVQFEYGGAALDAGTSLRDLYELLTARGYVVAKLFPRHLEVRSYWPWMENFAYSNYVALAPVPRG